MIYAIYMSLAVVASLEVAAYIRLAIILRRFYAREYVSVPSMLEALPSVSVCIPARNERHAMTKCLEAVLASTYPKMEVLVLDDDSVDNTSSLIKAFAREGVRFIQGGELPEGWLGKNHALRQLLDEASGTYVVFLDVDTILAPSSLAQIVAYAEARQANMVSVLPRRSDLWRASVLVAPLRYFWHVLFHRPDRPVAASGVWMARRKELIADFDDLSELRMAMEPEVDIARRYFAEAKYYFLTSRRLLGVTYEKKMSSQIETTVRLRFPEYGYSVLRTLASSVLKLAIALSPFVWLYDVQLLLPALCVYVLGASAYYVYLSFVWQHGAFVGMWLWQLVLIGDAYLSLESMARYLTGSVTWKGRPITSTSRRSPVE